MTESRSVAAWGQEWWTGCLGRGAKEPFRLVELFNINCGSCYKIYQFVKTQLKWVHTIICQIILQYDFFFKPVIILYLSEAKCFKHHISGNLHSQTGILTFKKDKQPTIIRGHFCSEKMILIQGRLVFSATQAFLFVGIYHFPELFY